MNLQTSASRGGLFLSAALLGSGFIAGVIADVFHPTGIDPNNHVLVFVQYAHSSGWTADHLGFFLATTLTIVGFLVLIDAVDFSGGAARTVNRLVMVLGATAIGLSALRYAVDGVVLKRAVDAWVSAPETEQASRFAAAELARWMEEASASYQGFVLGAMLLAVGGVIVWTRRVPRPIGYLSALAGLSYAVAAWVVGESGFAPEGAIPTYVAELVPPVCAIYLLVLAWRRPGVEAEPSRSSSAAMRGEA